MNHRPRANCRRRVLWRCVALGLPAVALFVLPSAGCRNGSSTPSDGAGQTAPEVESAWRDELFDYAIDNLNRLEEFDGPEMLKQSIDRLDRWASDQKPLADWQLDPLVATLPDPLRDLPVLDDLERLEFTLNAPQLDNHAFLEAAWMHHVSNWARGDEVGDLPRVKRLFDWTVRNIQLDSEPELRGDGGVFRVLPRPWEMLLLGRGPASGRAWVFMLLLRQQGLDAALIVPAGDGDVSRQDEGPWLVGVLSDGDLYLFDPTLGLPVPAAGGVKLDSDGRLDIEPATLSDVVADDGLLRKLDLEDRPYPLESSELEDAVVLLEASPSYLSQRMKLVETRLASGDKLVLSIDATAQAERMKECRHVAGARLWTLPYRTLLQEDERGQLKSQWLDASLRPFRVGDVPALWKGRSYHLKGILVGEPSATAYYQLARPSNQSLKAPGIDRQTLESLVLAKIAASYWLGLIAAGQQNDRAAIDYFQTRTLNFNPGGRWAQGARYNLARVYEGTDQVADAINLYRADTTTPARHGNLLRAAWLESLAPPQAAEPADADATPGDASESPAQ